MKGNSGSCNNGSFNSGDWNNGNRNSGDYNNGSSNSGDYNNGSCNSGDLNNGSFNSGNRNSGSWNNGGCNSGNHNSGSWNSGDWNSGNRNSGCFNTETPKINFFNKPSEWTIEDWYNSKAYLIMNKISPVPVQWIYSEDMTDREKADHPNHETTGGYLKVVNQTKDNQVWWDNLSEREKGIIKSLPNFDADIFEKITGIVV